MHPPPATRSAPSEAKNTISGVSVRLPLPLEGAFDYAPGAFSADDLAVGSYVTVPFGARRMGGVVWGPPEGAVAPEKLKAVTAVSDLPPMPDELRRFVMWVADYTLSPLGSVLRMAISIPDAFTPPALAVGWRRADRDPAASDLRWTPARQRVWAAAEGPARTAAALARDAATGPSVIKGLAAAGLLEQVALPPPRFPQPDHEHPGPDLSPAQRAAANDLRQRLANADGSDPPQPVLLDGVTGSGKTEVYFEAIAAALAAGKQALVLLPEIALTAQWLDRFEARFGCPPVQWHSELTGGQRRAAWRAIASGDAQVVVGARSALYLPFPRLGLIVVDEEHESAFKQEDGVVYQARDMAVVRGRLAGAPVVLVSATPSLETVVNADNGRYGRLDLPERHGAAAMPAVSAIDMRRYGVARTWLSPPLREALAASVAAGEQAMLFLNRRGYAPLTLCRSCGHRCECPNCSAWLVEHRLAGRLVCHHCGHQASLPESCPSCGAEDSLVACGPGVERVAEELTAVLPEARVAMVTSDTVRGPADAAAFVQRMQDGDIDVLVGTQIMAKGHHFPRLTLVGVVDADLGLAGGDLRAAERTYQLLHQVSGRAGRAEHPGRALLQTYMPEHPVIAALASGDRAGFLQQEAAARRAGGWPPFGRLAALIVSSPFPDRADRFAALLARRAPQGPGLRVLGPADAPLSVLRGRHRRRLLLHTARNVSVQQALHRWLDSIEVPRAVRLQVDIDPYSFL